MAGSGGGDPGTAPILAAKAYAAPSEFLPANLLREARRQKGIAERPVPAVCALDPDGDIVRHLRRRGARNHPAWPCYHTDMVAAGSPDGEIGVVGCAVGAPFAVLVAEEMFACGCGLLVSVTSAGQLGATRAPPYFVVIDRARRDEGTSYHYLPPAAWSEADAALAGAVHDELRAAGLPIERGATWTTDAPFRETGAAILAAREAGAVAVEMEAAALYAFARARGRDVVCLAHVTNRMARGGDDFEKGEAHGAIDALSAIAAASRAWRRLRGM